MDKCPKHAIASHGPQTPSAYDTTTEGTDLDDNLVGHQAWLWRKDESVLGTLDLGALRHDGSTICQSTQRQRAQLLRRLRCLQRLRRDVV